MPFVRFSIDKLPSAGNVRVYLVGRRVSGGDQYRANIRIAPNGTVFAQATHGDRSRGYRHPR